MPGTIQRGGEPCDASARVSPADRDESVRTAAAEAISRVGSLEQNATEQLVQNLASSDNMVRSHAAEALGTIGAVAEAAAPRLVDALSDKNDRVRAKAVKALGQIGEAAAATAVPGLVTALRDRDNWVSAWRRRCWARWEIRLMKPFLHWSGRSEHLNPEVRGNAAEAIGKMGTTRLCRQTDARKTGSR